ncbi:MAG: cyclic nucleotide-binding domain-containing protein [Pseudomonadota bacterium]
MKGDPDNIDILPEALEQLGYGESFKETLCDMLEQVALFQYSSRKDIECLADYIHAYQAPAGCTLLTEGEREKLLWFIVEGKVDVYKETRPGEQKRLATIRAGKTLGEMAMIDDQPHSASVVTASDCKLLLLTKQSFLRLAGQYPRLGLNITWKIAQLLSQRLRQTSGQLIDHL